MSNVTITQFTNYTSIFKAGIGIPELIIPRGAASFRTSKFDASGVIQQDDLIVVVYDGKEVPLRVVTDVITIKSTPTASGVVFSSASGTTAGKLLDLKIKLDEVFIKAGGAASLTSITTKTDDTAAFAALTNGQGSDFEVGGVISRYSKNAAGTTFKNYNTYP